MIGFLLSLDASSLLRTPGFRLSFSISRALSGTHYRSIALGEC